MIPQSTLDDIRARADLAAIAARYLGELRRAGADWKACCPWHDDTNPSMSISPRLGRVKCFVCDKSVDVIGLVMDQEGISFPEAVKKLADETGVRIPDQQPRELPGASRAYRRRASHPSPHPSRTGSTGDGGSAPEFSREQLRWVMAAAVDYWQDQLTGDAGQDARAYLTARGVTDGSIQCWQIGYAPDGFGGLREHLRTLKPQASESILRCAVSAGILRDSDDNRPPFERLRDRIIFPVRDPGGSPVGAGGRILNEDRHEGAAKYLNTSESGIYRKGHLLYGMDLAMPAIRKEGRAVLVEGYMDVIAMHQVGLENTVGVCGTAFTVEQAALIARNCGEVVAFMDPDEAGQKAVEKITKICHGVGVAVRQAACHVGEMTEEAS